MSRKTKPKSDQPVSYKCNTYDVTFIDNTNKFSKPTRTVRVHCENDFLAERIVHDSFGSISIKNMIPTPSNKIKILEVKQVKSVKDLNIEPMTATIEETQS